jgi:phospholipase/carboxylesterase
MDLLPNIEVETAEHPTHSVIWLHGLGANGDDFVPVVPELGLSKGKAVRFIFPHAPQRPVTINGGYVMPAWYDILSLSDTARQIDVAGITTSRAQINALIAREVARGIPANHIVIAGFSQGGAMAYSIGLSYPERLAGVVALSAYLPAPAWLAEHRSAANHQTPLLVVHGTQDPVVSLALGQQAHTWLQQHEYAVTWQTYPMAHQVCLQEIQVIGAWLNRVLVE